MEKRAEDFEECDLLSTWTLRGLYSAKGITGWDSIPPPPCTWPTNDGLGRLFRHDAM